MSEPRAKCSRGLGTDWSNITPTPEIKRTSHAFNMHTHNARTAAAAAAALAAAAASSSRHIPTILSFELMHEFAR